jgi:hypothetical protein
MYNKIIDIYNMNLRLEIEIGIFGAEKSITEIECYYWIYKAKNSLAINILLQKQHDAVKNELNFMTQILESHYNNK